MTRKNDVTRLRPVPWMPLTSGGIQLIEVISGEIHRYSLEPIPGSTRFTVWADGRAVATAPNLEEGKNIMRRFRVRGPVISPSRK